MAESTGPRSNRRWIPALLLVIFAAQSLWFIGTQSLTYDEPLHIYAGLESWQYGRFETWIDHPPLGRYWLTLPLARAQVEISDDLEHVTTMNPGPEWIAWHTRPMNTLLGVALGIVLWFAARRLFSEGAANATLALFAFTPSLIAHFSLATTDGVGALFVFLAAFQLVRWRSNPTRVQTVLMGLVLGGLLLSKMYTPPVAVLALGLMLVLGREQVWKCPREWNWKPALAALGIASVIFWAGYQFHISRVKMGGGQILIAHPHRTDMTFPVHFKTQINFLLPAAEYAEGLRLLKLSSHYGRSTWFLGKVYPNGGPWLYFPAAIVLKWPTILLLLFSASLVIGVRKTCRAPADLLVISLFGLLFLALALQSRITIGERHLLPLYPFALLIAGGLWEHARRYRLATATVVIALLLNAADTLRYAPDYLGYFNIFIKPSETWRLLSDSNLDWGQGLIALRSYQRQHPEQVFHLAYFGSVSPLLYGVQSAPLSPNQQVNGTVIVSATRLSGQTPQDHEGYRWLSRCRLQLVINHSLWVFDTAER